MNVFNAGKGNLSTMISLTQEWYLSNRDYGDYRSVNDWQIARKSNFFTVRHVLNVSQPVQYLTTPSNCYYTIYCSR